MRDKILLIFPEAMQDAFMMTSLLAAFSDIQWGQVTALCDASLAPLIEQSPVVENIIIKRRSLYHGFSLARRKWDKVIAMDTPAIPSYIRGQERIIGTPRTIGEQLDLPNSLPRIWVRRSDMRAVETELAEVPHYICFAPHKMGLDGDGYAEIAWHLAGMKGAYQNMKILIIGQGLDMFEAQFTRTIPTGQIGFFDRDDPAFFACLLNKAHFVVGQNTELLSIAATVGCTAYGLGVGGDMPSLPFHAVPPEIDLLVEKIIENSPPMT